MDITDRKRLEYELLIAKQKAEQANELKTKFIQNMQHDIRTPLAGVYQYMEAWAEEETDEEKRRCAELMRASTGQLLNMCNELVDFENIDYLGDELTLEVVDTHKFLSRVIDLNKMAAHSRGLEIGMLIEPNVPARLKLDKKKLYRVLVNLIGNSLKFTEEGSVILRVKTMSQTQDTTTLAFEIHDTGVGIPADKVDLIFDKFVRLTPSNQSKYKGSGLGLFYVKKFVYDMGGRLEVESVEKQGSVFRVILTLSIPHEHEMIRNSPHDIDTFAESVTQEAQKFSDTHSLSKTSTLSNPITISATSTQQLPQILLIEDDILQQKMITRIMANTGGHVAKIVDSVGLSCAAISELPYDLVISDLGIVGGTGIDVMSWTKQNTNHPNQHTPFIALTANSDDAMQKKALATGFRNVYQKPLTPLAAQEILARYTLKKESSTSEPALEKIIDVDASLEIVTDKSMLKELFGMLSESLVNDRKQLHDFYEKNDIQSTRELLHRLDGTLRYCIAPKLQKARGDLHEAIHSAASLTSLTLLYNDFYKEIDNYLDAYAQLNDEDNWA
jgi:nitrogen-specific signal transduction histidine kinase/response regulator of citrate/malate metabolism